MASKAPREKSLKELTTLLKSDFKWAPIVIAEQYRFCHSEQAVGESITEYMAEMRKLTTHCKFEDTVGYLECSCDCFVCGLQAESMRKPLLTEKNHTFPKALGIAHNLETVIRPTAFESRGIRSHTQSDIAKACERGMSLLWPDKPQGKWKFKEDTCHNCGKKGYIKVACRSKKQPQLGRWISKTQRDDQVGRH